MDRTGISWKTILGFALLTVMFFVVARCGWVNRDTDSPDTIVRSITSDTVLLVKHDTVFIEKPLYVERTTIDTVYIENGGSKLSLPVEKLRYSEDGIFDIWVSGIEASLDSVRFYAPTVERTVTRTVTVERKPSWACVPYMGFKAFEGTVSPNIGLMLETPKSWVLGAEMGYSKPRSTYWGLSIGYRFGK